MRLLIQHPHAPGDISGVLSSINEMLPALAERAGVELRVLSSRGASWPALWRAARWSDAVMLNSNCAGLLLCARLLGRRTLLKLHYPQYQTVHWHYAPMPFARRIQSELLHLLRLDSSLRYIALSIGRLGMRSLVAMLAQRVCACSRFTAEQASLPRRVLVLKNPLAIAPDLPARRIADLDRPPRFVFVGRLSQEKGWDTLLDAAHQLCATGQPFVIDIVGDGPDRARVQERIANAAMAGRIRWLGRLEPEMVKARLVGALAVVVPSRVQEQAGYVAVEAAAAQVAAIVSRVGGLPETAGADCPAFDADDVGQLTRHMAALVDHPCVALDIGRKAHLRARKEFDPTRIADEMLALLEHPADVAPSARIGEHE